MTDEEQLTGGNSSLVSRVGPRTAGAGGTVRREAGPWTPQVQALLRRLREQGIREVPEPLGLDEQGREVLSFIPGEVGLDPLPERLRGEEILVSAARLLRRIHDASAEMAQDPHAFGNWPPLGGWPPQSGGWPPQFGGWRAPTREPVEVICHGDFAPYNCVFDGEQLVGVIDFDHAHPGPRLWDLAYALYRFAPVTAPSNPDGYGDPPSQARRARLFWDAYGLQERGGTVEAVLARVGFMAERLRQGAAQGDARMQANIAAGHLDIYVNDCAYLEAHRAVFEEALD